MKKHKQISQLKKVTIFSLISIISSIGVSSQIESSAANFVYEDSFQYTNHVRLYDWIPTQLNASSAIFSGKCARVSWVKPNFPNMENYVLQWSNNSNFSGASSKNVNWPEGQYSISAAEGYIVGLTLNTRYYFRVRAINELTSNDWSEVFSFVTDPTEILGDCSKSEPY